MTDYIKREDAYKAVADNNYSDSIMLARYDAILESIGNIKPADVRENVHAKWVFREDESDYWDYWECSNCHNEFLAEGDMKMKYCPSCGAKMDGGADHRGMVMEG